MTKTPDPNVVEKTVEILRQRISEDREYISRLEARTRAVLIDPLLRSLGWNPEISRDVQLEYVAQSGRFDYALMRDGELVAVIEAKRLDAELSTEVHLQVIRYIQDPECTRIMLVAFTDGDEWILCRESNDWKAETVKISSNQPFKTAFAMVDCLSPSKLGVGAATKPRRAAGTARPPRRGKWYPLVGDLPNKLPTAVRLGDERPYDWKSWRDLYTDVAAYLVETGFIRDSDLPVWVANGKYCAINDEPIHPGPDRKQFGKPVQIGDAMWLESYGNRNSLRDYSGRLLRKFHSDPESVQVRFD